MTTHLKMRALKSFSKGNRTDGPTEIRTNQRTDMRAYRKVNRCWSEMSFLWKISSVFNNWLKYVHMLFTIYMLILADFTWRKKNATKGSFPLKIWKNGPLCCDPFLPFDEDSTASKPYYLSSSHQDESLWPLRELVNSLFQLFPFLRGSCRPPF